MGLHSEKGEHRHRIQGKKNYECLEQINRGSNEGLEALVRLKMDKSPGSDELYPRLLWEARQEIAGAVLQNLNLLWPRGKCQRT